MTEKNSIGWQKQPNKLNIQGEIEKAIGEITGEEIDLIASGRTDAGVHSLGQTANFKKYRYTINNSQYGSAIYRDMEYHFPFNLDVNKMQEASKYFEGEHDFKAFKASGTSSKSSVRTIYKAEIIKNEDRIYIELTGNGFLYNMVRIISGTLVDVGTGKIKPEEIKDIIESKERIRAGKTLPARGLCLMEVNY